MNDFAINNYKDFVSSSFIVNDKKQIEILEVFEKIWKEKNKINFFLKSNKINGIYLYGSVGSGKTFLINLFIKNIKKTQKYHFNHLMINLHAFINNHSDKESALDLFIKNLSKKFNLIFIDELHIFNIVDALLIKKIFNLFDKYKIFILVSSNFEPKNLYENGLQRNDFIPFVYYIEKNFKILHLNNSNDYRRQMLNQSKTYFSPINQITINEFDKLFKRFVDESEIHIRKIQTNSRVIRFEKCTANINYCDFRDLCSTNLGVHDYLNIAKIFSVLFIKNVPIFSDSNLDQCRRFISLIDMLYENKCSVIILAEKPINQLCIIENVKKEFERTTSRLYEMTIINSEKQ